MSDQLRQAAQAALEARDDLAQVLSESMSTGGWIPTPVQQSFRLALMDEQIAAEALRAALAELQPKPMPDAVEHYGGVFANHELPQPEPVACQWCCGTGKFADHLCRFCAGQGKGSVFAAPQALQPLKERPDFIAGYTAGLADGKACAERDAQEQPQPEPLTPEQRAGLSPATLRRYDEARKAASQAQQTRYVKPWQERLPRSPMNCGPSEIVAAQQAEIDEWRNGPVKGTRSYHSCDDPLCAVCGNPL